MMKYPIVTVLLLAGLAAAAEPAPEPAPGPGWLAQNQQAAVGPDQAAAAARRATDGKVLGVSREPGGQGYRVKVLYRDGRVRLIRVDARTGRVEQ